MPLAENPELLSEVIGAALGMPGPKMLECETGPDGRPWFIGFEWNGRADYLNEGDRGSVPEGRTVLAGMPSFAFATTAAKKRF